MRLASGEAIREPVVVGGQRALVVAGGALPRRLRVDAAPDDDVAF
jgi:hypothetical protein